MSDKQLLLEENCVLKSVDYNEYQSSHWRTKWLKKLAKPEIFLINFSIVAIFQGATFTYMIGSLSTLEKRYAFESKITGVILIADNVSQVIISPLIGYLGNKYNRPRIMAIGEFIAAFSCIVFAIPYFIYGPAVYLMHDTRHGNTTYELCKQDITTDDCNSNTIWPAVVIFWLASFLNGVGYTAFYTIGIPYIDDNTSKKNSPIYLSASAAIRLFGPAMGILLSSQTLKWYENPKIEPNIDQTDPRWIGCWWLGFIIIGFFLFLFSIPLLLFPSQMSDKQKNPIKPNKSLSIKCQFSEAWNAIKRLSANPIFVFHVLGITFKIIGYLGYYIFKPKYIESQFRKSASAANFWTGIIILPTMAFGLISSGIILSKVKPTAKNCAIYVFVVEFIISFCVLYAKTLQCPTPLFPQTQLINGKFELESTCNIDCGCNTKVFQPVCSDDGVSNFFSACYAGCTQETVHDLRANKRTFSNCKCNELSDGVTNGYCSNGCNQFISYIVLFAIVGIVTSTGKIGDTLITLRCVEPEDKNFAIGITGAVLAICAFIPYPLIFGAITDSACKVWKKSCGKTGNCWLYDIEKLTNYLHNSAFGFMIVGTIFHFIVILYANRIKNMFDDEDIDSCALGPNDNAKHEKHDSIEDKVCLLKQQ